MQSQIQGVIFDIDGVLEYQGRTYPGALEAIETLHGRGKLLRFLTNSTLKSRRSAAARLQQKGFPVSVEEVITASAATAMYLKQAGARSIWLMLDREGREEFQDFQHDAGAPEYVVVGDNRSSFDFEHLNHALRLIQHGAKLVGMQSELIDSSMGDLELNVGSWVGMLERAAGVQAVYIGKPNPYGFQLTLQTMQLEPARVLMVGDRMSTDIVGAHALGLKTLLVCSGEFTPADLESGPAPDYVRASIAEALDLFSSL